MNLSYDISVFLVGTYKARKRYDARISEELGNLADTADIFFPISS